MCSLHNLAIIHQTNKAWHGYMSFYEKLFDSTKDTVLTFLEIGISKGASLMTWRDYFKNATIYGIDLFIPDMIRDKDRIVFAVADQSNQGQLNTVMNIWDNPTFDIIIDDGGHSVKQQRVSIETLWKSVKPGGYYVIEDLHTNIRAIHSIHPHLNSKTIPIHIDELPSVHDKILNIMAGSKNEFQFDISEISEIYYFNTPNKLSLSCAFKKIDKIV